MRMYYVYCIDDNNVVDTDYPIFEFYRCRELLDYIYYSQLFILSKIYIECYSDKRGYQEVSIHDNCIGIGSFFDIPLKPLCAK